MEKIKENKNIIIASLLISILICCVSVFFEHGSTEIEIKHNNSAANLNGDQIYISRIMADDWDISLFEIELSKGWEYNPENDDIYTVGDDIESLFISLPKAEYIYVYFTHTNPKTCEIVDGNFSGLLGEKLLETNNEGTVRYKVQSNLINNFDKVPLIIAISFLLYFSIMFLLLYLTKINNKLFALVLALIFYETFIKNRYIKFDSSLNIAIFTIVMLSGIFIKDILESKRFKKYKTKKAFILTLISSFYFTFSLVGHRLFLSKLLININIMNFSIFILVFILIFAVHIYAFYCLDYVSNYILERNKTKKQNMTNITKKKDLFFIEVFVLSFSIAFLISTVFYPINFTYDGGAQIVQAFGFEIITDTHPAIHTIFLKIFTLGTKNIFMISVVHNIIWSALMAKFCVFFNKKGISKTVLIIFCIVMNILPNNYLMITLMSKNILFALLMLWLTYLTMIALEDPVKYFKNIFNIILYSLCLSLVYTVRHNAFLIIIALVILLIRVILMNWETLKLRPLLTLVFTVIFVSLIQGPIYNLFGVDKSFTSEISSSSQNALILALGNAYINDVPLDEDSLEYLESIVDLDELHQKRTNIHRPLLGIKINWENTSLKDSFYHYLKLLVKHPSVPFKDRLNGTDQIWNIGPPPINENYRYSIGMKGIGTEKQKYLEQIINPEWKLKDNDYYLNETKTLTYIIDSLGKSQKIQLVDMVLWRNGIYLSFSILLLAHSIINKKYNYIYIWLFLFLIVVSLMLIIDWQIYQYIWFFPLCFVFLFIYYLCYSPEDKKTRETKKKRG